MAAMYAVCVCACALPGPPVSAGLPRAPHYCVLRTAPTSRPVCALAPFHPFPPFSLSFCARVPRYASSPVAHKYSGAGPVWVWCGCRSSQTH